MVDPGPDDAGGVDSESREDSGDTIDPEPPDIIEPPEPPTDPRKFYVTKGKVTISTHLTQDLDAEGKQLRATESRDYTSEVVRSLFVDVAEFRHGWADPDRRAEILAELEARGISSAEAGEAFGYPDADPFDLLCNIAWNAPVLTRKERAAGLREHAPSFFEEFGEQVRQILDALLTKYAEHGPAEFTIPDSLKVPPLSDLGNVSKITQRFGGADELRDAVARLQAPLYAA